MGDQGSSFRSLRPSSAILTSRSQRLTLVRNPSVHQAGDTKSAQGKHDGEPGEDDSSKHPALRLRQPAAAESAFEVVDAGELERFLRGHLGLHVVSDERPPIPS
jgi:hypothetical protein